MAHVSDLIATDIERYLKQHETKSLLRFITCGSVDDGKSTLIGRLLYDSKMLFEDQLSAIEADSVKWGTQGGEIDFALLVDGLAAEREQGITIDVAYRYFSTDRRKFIVADTPGHEQYTRNMVTGASTADVAVVLVDARRGVLTQTRRHSFLVSLIGIRRVVLAINKMDLVGYSEAAFDAIVADYRAFAQHLELEEITAIPLSALRGDNMLVHSEHTPWYQGPTLMGYLETVDVGDVRLDASDFRLPVQWVNRPNLDFRGFSGTIASGMVRPGDRILAQPSGRQSTVARIVTANGDLPLAVAGQSITLTLADEIDISRGTILSNAAAPAELADRFQATVVWMAETPLTLGRSYLLKIGTQTVTATLGVLRHKVDVNTMERVAASTLSLNEIGLCELTLDRVIAFDPYADNRDTGGFILIDRLNNGTIAAGLLRCALRPGQGASVRSAPVDKAARARMKGQQPCVLWFSGQPAPVAADLVTRVEQRLHPVGRHTVVLHGEGLRHAGEVAPLMVEAGLIVLVVSGSPDPAQRAQRAQARSALEPEEFIDIHVHATRLPGVQPDVAPDGPAGGAELLIDAAGLTADEVADRVVGSLQARRLLA